jgi:hypothetical protein
VLSRSPNGWIPGNLIALLHSLLGRPSLIQVEFDNAQPYTYDLTADRGEHRLNDFLPGSDSTLLTARPLSPRTIGGHGHPVYL